MRLRVELVFEYLEQSLPGPVGGIAVVNQVAGYGKSVPCTLVGFNREIHTRLRQRGLQTMLLFRRKRGVDFRDADIHSRTHPVRQQVRAIGLVGGERPSVERQCGGYAVWERSGRTQRKSAAHAVADDAD